MTSYQDLFGTNTVPPAEASYGAISISVSSTLAWTGDYSGLTPNQYLVSSKLDVTPLSASLELLLPPANRVSVGQDILIRNVGAFSVTIADSLGNNGVSLPPGVAKVFFVTDNSSVAGTWGVFTLGTGTSGADATALAGYGLRVMSSKLNSEVPYQPINSNYTVQELNRAAVINALTGAVTIDLPTASSMSPGFYTLVRNSATGNVVIEPNGSELIDGSSNKTLAPDESLILICTGLAWITVGFGRDATFVFGEVVVNAASPSVTLTSQDVAGRMIRVSGTATSNITVTLPNVDNIYFVSIEAVLGAYSVTFTTGLGSTTALGANQKTVLYCDGTNVTPAITTTVTSSLSLVDGNPPGPSISWALDPDTGFYRSSSGVAGFASNGTSTLLFGPNGIVFASTQGLTANNLSSACDELKVLIDSVNTSLSGSISTLTSSKANLSGAAFTGAITVPAGATGSQVPRVSEVLTSISSAIAASEATTNAAIALKVNKAGDTFTGPVRFNIEYDNGNSGAAKTIDFNNGQKQKVTFTGNCTLTLAFPSGVGNYVLRGLGDGTGYTVTWPGTAKFVGGIAPLAPLGGGTAIYTVYYDGAVAHISGGRE